MVKAVSKPVSEKELIEESDIEEEIEKDALNQVNVTPDDTNYDSETYVGLPAQDIKEDNKSYIQQRKSYNMSNVDKNKLMNTHIGDHINYFDNGKQDNGIVTKMSSSFITIVKEDGIVHDVHINDTFFVSDILLNKTWNDMDMEEKTEQLMKVHAYSPRYLSKTWEQLPRELKDVMKEDGGEGDSGMLSSTDGRSVNNPTHNPRKPKTNVSFVNASGEYTYSEKPEYKLKGIPEDTGNSWGIKYINKDEEEE
jgi:hypothetical protein